MPEVKEDGTIDEEDPHYMYNKNNYTIIGEEGSTASEIRESVGKYGGFYIAKYEAGVPVDENGIEIDEANALPTQKARSVPGAKTWGNMTSTDIMLAAENMIDSSATGVHSALLSAECWDTTLQWMVSTSDNAGYDTNSTGKGWYKPSNNVNAPQKEKTGKSEEYEVNNIYDMAGNVWECTTEKCIGDGDTHLVFRGGSCMLMGNQLPAAMRTWTSLDDEGDTVFAVFGFRAVLYK